MDHPTAGEPPSHGYPPAYEHAPHPPRTGPGEPHRQSLRRALAITGSWMLVELVGGLLTNSLALVADAGHMLSDFGSLALSLAAIHLAGQAAPAQRTYGNYRLEILAAAVNGATLVAIALYIFYEAAQRLAAPPPVQSGLMMGVAGAGLAANLACIHVLSRAEARDNLNLRSAFLHVAGDAMGSVGALGAGALMYLFGWYLADPIIGMAIGVLILAGALRITRDAAHVLLEGAPRTADLARVRQGLSQIPGVQEIHDLHIWTITSGIHAFSCHLVLEPGYRGRSHEVLVTASRWVREHLGIQHSTIQVEEKSLRPHEDPKV